MVDGLNRLEGVTCTDPEGALYCFPTVTLPKKVWDLAHKSHRSPEFIYCLELLEATGIVVVPGKGFQQKDGTSHFR
jgi:alanine transaminase